VTCIWLSIITPPIRPPEVRAWLGEHPRLKLHFTTTSASSLNLMERFFAEITSKRIRRSSYPSVDDLETAIYDYLTHHNEQPEAVQCMRSLCPIEIFGLNRLTSVLGTVRLEAHPGVPGELALGDMGAV